MSSNTSMYACPKCGNPNTHAERRPDGFCYCPDCQHRWKIRESQPKPTVFDTITASPEVLAEKLVYCNVQVKTTPSTSREQPGGVELTKGWYSTIIPAKVWSNEEEAYAATVAKLKEVTDAETR